MAQVVYAPRALTDLERFLEFFGEDLAPARAALRAIADAVRVLGRHPLIGRVAEHGMRELVISRGRSGYIALYRYLPEDDTVLVLTFRHQKEAGYVEE